MGHRENFNIFSSPIILDRKESTLKTIIIGITAAIGLFGGAISLIGNYKTEEIYPQNYMNEVPVEYINFTEPMEIKGYVVK